MGLKRKGGEQKSEGKIVYTNLDVDKDWDARLVYVADLGLHENNYRGEEKPDVQKIALGFEILGETVEIDGVATPKMLWDSPFNIYFQLTEKGTELIKYKQFNPKAKEGEVADWNAVLGTPVTITVEHVKAKKGYDVYDNIASFVVVPKKYQKGIAKGELPQAVGDSEDENNEATKALYGLTRWFYDRRVREEDSSSVESTPYQDDDIPF